MISVIDTRRCQTLQDSCDNLTVDVESTVCKEVSEALQSFNEAAKRRLIQGLDKGENLMQVCVPLAVFNLELKEREELEDILKNYGGWVPQCGDRWTILFTPEAGLDDPLDTQLTYLSKTGRFCKTCHVFTEYRDTDDQWVCPSCGRWVSCYASSDFPMGSVATSAERRNRIKAHNEIDRLWKDKLLTRREVYAELSEVLNLPRPYTHIAMMESKYFPIIETWAKARWAQIKGQQNKERN